MRSLGMGALRPSQGWMGGELGLVVMAGSGQ